MNIRFAAFTTPLLLVFALSGSLAFAEGDEEEPAKPNCPKGQVWDSKQQKCLMQDSSLVPDADRTDYANRDLAQELQQITSIGGSTCEEYQHLAAAINDSSKT
jgi:hypothetical protein